MAVCLDADVCHVARPRSRGWIRGLSRDLGITFVVVTHELQSIYAIADRCVMLDTAAGTQIAEGRPADLRDHSDNPTVRQFFLRQAAPAPGTGNAAR